MLLGPPTVESVFRDYVVRVIGRYGSMASEGCDARIRIKGEAGETREVKLITSSAASSMDPSEPHQVYDHRRNFEC